MIKFASFLLVGLMVMGASTAFAATADLSWTAPDTRVDGTPLAAGEVSQYLVYFKVDAVPTRGGESVMVTGGVTETITLDLVPRAEAYVVSFAVSAVDSEGRESDLSAVVSKTFMVNSTAAPNPPTNIRVTITCADECTITEKTGSN